MPEVKFDYDPEWLTVAIEEALTDVETGAIPIGSTLLYDDGATREVYRGHNRRVQQNSAILHAEMDCIESAKSRPAKWYKHTTLFTTLFPCPMCSGTSALLGIPRIVIGEATNFPAPEDLVKAKRFLDEYGIEYQIVDDERCITMLRTFIAKYPQVWHADVPYQPLG